MSLYKIRDEFEDIYAMAAAAQVVFINLPSRVAWLMLGWLDMIKALRFPRVNMRDQ